MTRKARNGANEYPTRIREFREMRGLSAAELANMVGTTGPTITRMETGKHAVTVDWLFKIAHALNIPATAFIDFSDSSTALRHIRFKGKT